MDPFLGFLYGEGFSFLIVSILYAVLIFAWNLRLRYVNAKAENALAAL